MSGGSHLPFVREGSLGEQVRRIRYSIGLSEVRDPCLIRVEGEQGVTVRMTFGDASQ